MKEGSYKIKYSLDFQKFIGSVAASIVFFNLVSLIKLKKTDNGKCYRDKCASHMGKHGVCVTYPEMAEYLCMDTGQVREAMKKLKDKNLVGMDYVILEMIRAPFFFLNESADRFIESDQKELRFVYSHILKKTKSCNDSAVHGHIAYWNDKKKAPLIQSMSRISEFLGITYRQVQLSIYSLSNKNLIEAVANVDSRYCLTAHEISDMQMGDVGKTAGVGKTVVGLLEFEGEGSGIMYTLQGKPVDILEYHRTTYKLEGREEERTPTLFSRINSESEEKQDIQKTYKVMYFELKHEQYQELEKNYNAEEIRRAVTRYNKEWQKRGGPPKNDPLTEILQLFEWHLEDEVKDAKKEEQMRKEQEKADNTYPEPSEFMKRLTEKSHRPEAFEEQKQEKKEEERPQLKANQEVVEPKKVNIEHLRAIEEENKAKKEKRWKDFLESLSEEERGGCKI